MYLTQRNLSSKILVVIDSIQTDHCN
jgi:hypothetical protein